MAQQVMEPDAGVTALKAEKPARFDPIHSSTQMSELIASVTGKDADHVMQRLHKEFDDPGITVATDFESRGIDRYIMSDGMMHFYGDSDGFLYELAVWNRNANKRFMCARILELIQKYNFKSAEVLNIGDGMGFDSLELYRAGHRVTYFELPGKTEACARRIFKESAADILVLTDPAQLKPGCCDVLVCLDTLEHVPDPAEMIRQFVTYLRPGGIMFVHAPYYMIHPRYPTHLKSSRALSGSARLYTDQGLQLIDGDLFWNPLVLAKTDTAGRVPKSSSLVRWQLRVGGWILSLGRVGLLPLSIVHRVRCRGNRWFDKQRKLPT